MRNTRKRAETSAHQDYFEEVKKAAVEVYQEASASIQQKAPEFTQRAKNAAEDVKDAVNNAFGSKDNGSGI